MPRPNRALRRSVRLLEQLEDRRLLAIVAGLDDVSSVEVAAHVTAASLSTAEIHGTKFSDLNANGSRDASEPGLSNWTIYLDVNENGQLDGSEPSTLTDVDGNYAFTGLAAGNFVVAEILQAGWAPRLPEGVSASGRLFVSGTSANFYPVLSELSLAGEVLRTITMPVNSSDDQGVAVGPYSVFVVGHSNINSATTLLEYDLRTGSLVDSDPVGLSWVEGLAYLDGKLYFHHVQGFSDYISVWDPGTDQILIQNSAPVDLEGGLTGAADGTLWATTYNQAIVQIDPVTFTSGQPRDVDIDFFSEFSGAGFIAGQIVASTTMGSAYNGEVTLVRIDPATGDILGNITVPTGADLSGVGADGLPSVGYARVALADGEVLSGADLASIELSTVQGTVWDDADSNGQQDVGEAGVAARTVLLDLNRNGWLDFAEPSALTDANGHYQFNDVLPGDYSVLLQRQAGSQQTSPQVSRTAGRLFRSSGFIDEIDPLTGATLNTFSAPVITDVFSVEGLAVAPESLFYVAGNSEFMFDQSTGAPVTVWELDPDTGAVIDFDALPGYSQAGLGGVAYLDGQVYLLGTDGTIVVWDPIADVVVRTMTLDLPQQIMLAGGSLAAAPDLGVLFAGAFYDDLIYRVDPTTGDVLDSFDPQVQQSTTGGITGLAYHHGVLYADSGYFDTYLFDPLTGAKLATIHPRLAPVIGGLGGDAAGNFGAHEITVAAGESAQGGDFGVRTTPATVRSRILRTPLLAVGSDTGVSSTDRLTKHNNSSTETALSVRIGALPANALNTVVTIYHNFQPVASATHTGGTLVIPLPAGLALADGIHYFSAQFTEPGKAPSYLSPAIPVKVDTAAPTLDFTDLTSPVSTTAINSLTMVFSERVTQLDMADLVLTRDGGPNLLTTAQTISGDGFVTLGNLGSLTSTPGYYVLSFASGQNVVDRAGNSLGTTPILEFVTGVLGDIEADGDLDNFDIQPFEQALTNPAALLAERPQAIGYHLRGDIDGNGVFDNFDIEPFEQLLTSSSSSLSAAASSSAVESVSQSSLAQSAPAESADLKGEAALPLPSPEDLPSEPIAFWSIETDDQGGTAEPPRGAAALDFALADEAFLPLFDEVTAADPLIVSSRRRDRGVAAIDRDAAIESLADLTDELGGLVAIGGR